MDDSLNGNEPERSCWCMPLTLKACEECGPHSNGCWKCGGAKIIECEPDDADCFEIHDEGCEFGDGETFEVYLDDEEEDD